MNHSLEIIALHVKVFNYKLGGLMKKVKRLSLTLIIISLFSISALTTASAQGAPGMAPPGAPTDAPDPDPEIITDEEDHCQAMPPGAEQDECYIAEDDDAGPEDAHCEDLHAGDGPPLWEPTDADIDRFEGEYRENMKTGQGRLNEGTIAEIMSHGLTRAEVDCHVQEMAEAAMHDQEADEAPPAAVTAEIEGGAAGQPGMPPGTLPPGGMPPGTMPPGGMPPGQPGTGDPCMAVPAGPERDACHQAMAPQP